MSAEHLAAVVADLRSGNIDILDAQRQEADFDLLEMVKWARHQIHDPVVIDAQAIHDSLLTRQGEHINLIEDHPSVAPAFDEMVIGYEDATGKVFTVHVAVTDVDWYSENPNPPPAEDIRWKLNGFVYLGGYDDSKGRLDPVATTGAVYLWRIAVRADGSAAEMTYMDLAPSYGVNHQTLMLTMLGTLNFLNCSNVDVAEPVRPRAERRRIDRAGGGVKVQTIHIYPAGPLRRSGAKGEPLTSDGAVSPSRGHFAHYGEKYNRGLLFGKYEGKFWHPQRVRVKGERPDVDYEIHAAS